MNNKRKLLIAILFFIFVLPLASILFQRYSSNSGDKKPVSGEVITDNNENEVELDISLEGYPNDQVPLHKLTSISSMKFFVNDDPVSFGGYFGVPVNYYNVVFGTEAGQEEYIAYYKSLMSEVNEDGLSSSQVEGKIGKYKVSASYYESSSQSNACLQVYLPAEEYQEENRYYSEYPQIVKIDEDWTEQESSYGHLNQNGGEIEYTQYFTAKEDVGEYVDTYEDLYQDKAKFTYDEATGSMRWNDGDYSVVLTFSEDHGRVYLMIRKPLN